MTKVERHMDICKGLNEIYEQKNHDYGDSFHDTFVDEGMAMARIRLSDKLNRFKKLTRMSEDRSEGFSNVPMVKDESIRDTLLDLANYAIMTVMEMDILAEENKPKARPELLDKTFQLPQDFTADGDGICIQDDPCKKCGMTMEEKAACCGCEARLAWERKQKRHEL